VTIRRGVFGLWIAFSSIWLSLGFTLSIWDWWNHGTGASFLGDVLILLAAPATALVLVWFFEKVRRWILGSIRNPG
jgi:hypothetical protein